MFSRLLGHFRGARRIEWLVAAALIAAALLYLQPGGHEEAAGTYSQLEMRMEQVLGSVRGAGSVKVMVTQNESDGAVQGVLIVASGADDYGVRLDLQYAAKVLLDVEMSKIEVVAMKEGG